MTRSFLLFVCTLRSAAAFMIKTSRSTPQDSRKLGLVCQHCSVKHFREFNESASWFYTYTTRLRDKSLVQWANDHGVEFVPMIPHAGLQLRSGNCTFREDAVGSEMPLCNLMDLVRELLRTKRALTVKPRYLMAFNEPFDNNTAKFISAREAVWLWRRWIQPAAAKAGLKLVSPSVGHADSQIGWFSEFLTLCYAHRNDEEYPCNVENIEAFAVHEYLCAETFWRTTYMGGRDSFQARLKEDLLDYSGTDWSMLVDSTPIWVTETNCNFDDSLNPNVAPDPYEQCMRMTGQRRGRRNKWHLDFGEGSVKALERLPTVARYSWWNTYNPEWGKRLKTAAARLVNDAGELFPVGKALLSRGEPTDCNGGAPWREDIEIAALAQESRPPVDNKLRYLFRKFGAAANHKRSRRSVLAASEIVEELPHSSADS